MWGQLLERMIGMLTGRYKEESKLASQIIIVYLKACNLAAFELTPGMKEKNFICNLREKYLLVDQFWSGNISLDTPRNVPVL